MFLFSFRNNISPQLTWCIRCLEFIKRRPEIHDNVVRHPHSLDLGDSRSGYNSSSCSWRLQEVIGSRGVFRTKFLTVVKMKIKNLNNWFVNSYITQAIKYFNVLSLEKYIKIKWNTVTINSKYAQVNNYNYLVWAMSVFGIIMYLNYWTISCQIKVVQLAKKHRCKFKTCALIVNMQLDKWESLWSRNVILLETIMTPSWPQRAARALPLIGMEWTPSQSQTTWLDFTEIWLELWLDTICVD